MKLTYWIADCWDDAVCYSLRAKTKKECNALREEKHQQEGRYNYGPPRKVVIEYADGFDLVDQLLCEGGAEGSPTYRNDSREEE